MIKKEVRAINGKEIVLYQDIETGLYRFGKDAVDVLLEALEKQMPKKPLNDYCWHCPNCEEEVYWDTECGQQKFRYCHNCGQKIDWH